MASKQRGRPRLYDLPLFEAYLKNEVEIRHGLSRDYIRSVCQMLKWLKEAGVHTPNADDVIEAFDALPEYVNDIARAGWNHYAAFMKKSEGHYLPRLDRRIPKRTTDLSEEQLLRRGALKLFVAYTGCSMAELVGLTLQQVSRFRPRDPTLNTTIYRIEFYEPRRTCDILIDHRAHGRSIDTSHHQLHKYFREAFRQLPDYRQSRIVFVFDEQFRGRKPKAEEVFELLRTGVNCTSLRRPIQKPNITETANVIGPYFASKADQAIHRFLHDSTCDWTHVAQIQEDERARSLAAVHSGDEEALSKPKPRQPKEPPASTVDDWDDLFA